MDKLKTKTELSENIHIKVQHALLAAQETIKWILHDADIDIQREMLKELDSLLQENERLREEIKNLNEIALFSLKSLVDCLQDLEF